jgi:hypothetical protein
LARDLALTDAYVTSRRERNGVERLFAHLKRILKSDRLRLRAPNGAEDELLLAATAENLRKLAKLITTPTPARAGLARSPQLSETSAIAGSGRFSTVPTHCGRSR